MQVVFIAVQGKFIFFLFLCSHVVSVCSKSQDSPITVINNKFYIIMHLNGMKLAKHIDQCIFNQNFSFFLGIFVSRRVGRSVQSTRLLCADQQTIRYVACNTCEAIFLQFVNDIINYTLHTYTWYNISRYNN